MKNKWFATWFDSLYYHILYQHRDDKEAHFFIDNLVRHLDLGKNGKVLDLACGKGRHSIYLAEKGLEVVGVDLSPESIAHAQTFAQDNLSFQTHDMRQPIDFGTFDAVLNLFTSFGYFDNPADDIATLNSMKGALKNKDSFLVIDFFNAYKVIQQLVLKEEKTLQNILFKIERRVENGFIVKDIRFEDKGQKFAFQEKVKAFVLSDFIQLFEQVGLHLVQTFGDYKLTAFDPKTSNRLIMVLKS